MPRLHFSIGGTQNEDLQSIRDLEGNENEFNWTVPKDAEIGDEIFLIVPYISGPIRARGIVESETEPSDDFGGCYRAWISIERLKIPVHLTDLQNAFPDIDYFRNPKGRFTVKVKDTARVIEFVESYQREKSEIWRLGDQLSMRSDETLADSILEADERERIAASIVVRRGQRAFRENLLVAYEGRCAFSEVALKDVLEAAHIRPYLGEKSNDVTNGLLLSGSSAKLGSLWRGDCAFERYETTASYSQVGGRRISGAEEVGGFAHHGGGSRQARSDHFAV